MSLSEQHARHKKNAPAAHDGAPKHGAVMGRTNTSTDVTPYGPLFVSYVHLDEGGYDWLGTYWGHAGDDLYFVYGTDQSGNDIDLHIQALSTSGVFMQLRDLFPYTTFVRAGALTFVEPEGETP